jgi:primosomal protein N' (replication factor Y)
VTDRAVDVALPLPLQTPFSYRVPERWAVPERGVRVTVPFGPRRVIGIVTGPSAPSPEARDLKDVLAIVDEEPLLPPPLLDLAQWTADHYLAPPGECYRLALPPSGVRASRARVRLAGAASDDEADPVLRALAGGPLTLAALERRVGRDPAARVARLRAEGRIAIDQDLAAAGFRLVRVASLLDEAKAPAKRGPQEVIARLKAAGGRAAVADLVRDRPSLRAALDRLAEAGAIAIDEERAVRGPAVMDGGGARPETLTGAQRTALDAILPRVEGREYGTFLLAGVTGSGKTEVYFRAAEAALAHGLGVLILTPEIALTPFLVRAAAARFGPTVAVIHSELAAGERHDQWWRIRERETRVVVGARSAVFAPLDELGLIVVDEEHESSYKQDESPRYHARDVAVMRGVLEGVPVVLGSATPSLESYTNARKGKYTLLELPARIGAQGMPRVEVVDRRETLKRGGDAILTPPLRDALAARLDRREQSLLLLNRRGYATSLVCRECGVQASCPNCSVLLTLHQKGRNVECHYCGHQTPTPRACGSCRGEYLRLTGHGTEKVVEAVQAALPKAHVERLDRDLAARRGAVQKVLASFEAGKTDILVGTQMIAKGHDFPRVTLVGVIDADVGLGLPDFRAAERTFQLLTQVAGRAGRADLPGEVILQSHLPDHYALRFATAQDYASFYEREMEFRRTMAYPPVAALVNVVFRSRDADAAAQAAEAMARRVRADAPGRFRVLGPAFAPLAKLRQEHRFQVLLKGDRASMRESVRKALVEAYGAVRWPGVAVDVDPLTVL